MAEMRIIWISLALLMVFLFAFNACASPATVPKMTAPEPKMTAPEVCQYVNQALPISYESIPENAIIIFRYEVQCTALNASYQVSDSRWLVNVQVVKKPQRFVDNKWADTFLFKTNSSTQQYYFYEATGAVVKK